MDYKNFIQLSVSQGVNFSIGKAINDGFSHFGKKAGSYVGFTIVFFFLAIAASLFTSFIPYDLGAAATGIFVTPPLMMGFALYARKVQTENDPAFETFFDGFKINYKNLVLVNLILQLIVLALSSFLLLPFIEEFEVLFSDPTVFQDQAYLQEVMQEMFVHVVEYWWVFAIYFIVTIVIQVLYVLANYFVVFYNFGFWEAMECSRILIGKVFIKVIVLNIIMGIIVILGTLVTLGIGLLFLMPVLTLVNYSLFEQLAGFSSGDLEIEDDLIID